MRRLFFTALDIIQLSREQKFGTLMLGADDVITAEAEDVASALGLRIIRQNGGVPLLREQQSNLPDSSELPPLAAVHNQKVILEAFGDSPEARKINVKLKDVITSADKSPMSSGYMSLEQGEFHWKLNYDEIDIVLEGELVITRGSHSVNGKPGDVIFIPKGSEITFGSPSHARFVYVTYPADWNK